MVTIKEFIKENSPKVPKKKKRRVRFKNFNPFRKRKYKTLNEDHPDSGRQHAHVSSSADGQLNPSSGHINIPAGAQHTENQAQKRRRPKELFHAVWESLGLGKDVSPDDPNAEGGTQASKRKHGSTECLIDEETTADAVLVPDGDDVRNEPKPTDSQSESGGWGSEKENSGSGVKRVVISNEIEVIDVVTEDEAPTKIKKTKSKKKKLKKAGIRTAKMLGHGLTNMAVAFQYMTPDAAITPVAREIAKSREDRYRELSSLAYLTMS